MSAVLKTRTVIPLGDAGLGFIIAIDEDNGLFDALTGFKIKIDPLSVEGEQNITSVRIVIIAGITCGKNLFYDIWLFCIDMKRLLN